jgi:hypothetical protein
MSARLKRGIVSHSATAWHALNGVVPQKSPSGIFTQTARTLRQSGSLVAAYRYFARKFLPTVILALIVIALLLVASRLAFELAESVGLTCRSTATADLKVAKPLAVGSSPFLTSDACYASGIRLEKNNNYVVRFDVTQEWRDGSIQTSPRGFATAQGRGAHSWAQVAIRATGLRWFEPLARIKNTGRARIRMNPQQIAPGSATYESEEFTAKLDGELFLFVNDAVVALPWVWDYYYRHNNVGAATITVERKEPKPVR